MPAAARRAAPYLLASAVAVYIVLAAALVAVGPGPGHDETLWHAGAVHMLTSSGPPPFTHPPLGWVHTTSGSWPLMMMPYAGAVSFYLLTPVFAAFGPGVVAARAVAVALAAFGLWGVGRMVEAVAGGAAAGAAIVILAVHPGYLSNTVFNDSGLAYWMAAVGAASLAHRKYMEGPTPARAALLGLACGIAVWTRLNFVWLILAAAAGASVGFGRSALPSVRHLAAAGAGAIAGSAPLLWYLGRSAGRDTLAFIDAHQAAGGISALVARRLRVLAASLLYDFEHRRGLWEGPVSLPAWQVAFVGAAIAAGIVGAFLGREDGLRRWHRATAAALVGFAALMVVTRLPVRGHHFVNLLPLAALAVVLAAVRLLRVRSGARPAVAASAALYLAIALYWDAAAWRGLRRVGGTGNWSDAMESVIRELVARRPPRVAALDWGFQNPIYVTTNGRVDARELFWSDPSALDWDGEIAAGGVYLTHVPPYRYPLGEAPTARFKEALQRSGLTHSEVVYRDRLGRPHTELIEVRPLP